MRFPILVTATAQNHLFAMLIVNTEALKILLENKGHTNTTISIPSRY